MTVLFPVNYDEWVCLDELFRGWAAFFSGEPAKIVTAEAIRMARTSFHDNAYWMELTLPMWILLNKVCWREANEGRHVPGYQPLFKVLTLRLEDAEFAVRVADSVESAS